MKSKVVTDIELRSRWYANRTEKITVPSEAVLTPAAKDFIKENNIMLAFGDEFGERGFSKTPFPEENGRPVFIDAATGEKVFEKKENYTHLRGNILVPKTHPRIALRGKIDSLIADVIQIQIISSNEGDFELIEDLEELLCFIKMILHAEVTETPLNSISLLGMNSEELRYKSQNIKEFFGFDHQMPSYKNGAVCASLNKLRTSVRECELVAVNAFPIEQRIDIVEALNRLSSCIYILYCKKLSNRCDGGIVK